MAKRKAGMGRQRAARGLAAPSPASSSRKWAIVGVGSRAGAAFLLLCLLLPATVLLTAAASSSSKAAAAAKGGAYPLMAPLVTSWFKKGVGGGSKAPVAASAAATLLVRADGEVDLELAVDGPGSDSASSLLELVSGRRGGRKQQQQGGSRLAPASPPSPVEAARAAHALFLSLAARALAPVAQAASGALRRLAELLQQVLAAVAAAAAQGGAATQKAAHGPLRLVGMIGQAAVALMAAEEKDGGDDMVGGVEAFSFPQDTGAFLGATGRRVAGSVLRAAVQAGGHVGRAGQHVKNQALSSPPAQHAGRLAGVVVQGVATLLNQQSDNDTTAQKEEAVMATAAAATGPHGWFKKRRAASSAASIVSPPAPTRVPFLKPVASSPAAGKQQRTVAPDATTDGSGSGFGAWALLLLAFAGCGAAAMGGHGGALASVAAKAGPVVRIAGGAALRFLERKGVTAAVAKANAYLVDRGVHERVGHGWGRVQEGWAKVLVALAPAREAAERGCFHLGAGKDKAHALLLRLHWQLQQAYVPFAAAIAPALHHAKGRAASMAAAIAPAFHHAKGRATGVATETIAALLAWVSEARARLTERIVWSVIVHKARGWLNAVVAAVMALVASACAVWEERVASRRSRKGPSDQTTTKQEQQQQAPAVGAAGAGAVAAPASPASRPSEEGEDVKEQQAQQQQQSSPASAAASKATAEGGDAASFGASPIPGAAAATLTGYLAATASSFFFPLPTAADGKQSTESVPPSVVAPASKEEAKAQEQGAEQEEGGEQAEEGKEHPLAGSAHSSGSHASGGSGASSDSDGFEVVGQRAFSPLSNASAPSLPLAAAGSPRAEDEASMSEDDAALVAAVGHSLAMQQAEAEAEQEEEQGQLVGGKKAGVTGVFGRMMLTWGLGESFVVVERNPSPSSAAAETEE